MEMKLAAADAIASLVTEEDLRNGIIIPSPFNKNISKNVAKAVAEAAVKSGAAKKQHED